MVCETLTADKPEARSDTRYCSEDESIGLAQSLCCFRMPIDSCSEQDLVSDLASGLSL